MFEFLGEDVMVVIVTNHHTTQLPVLANFLNHAAQDYAILSLYKSFIRFFIVADCGRTQRTNIWLLFTDSDKRQ